MLVLHEILNTMHSKKQAEILFKIDFEKAYDNIKWPSVYKMLEVKGFSEKWCDWIFKVMR